MSKLERNIQIAEKMLKKLSKENHFESDELKAFVNSLELSISASKNDLSEMSELKNALEVKKRKLSDQRSELKGLINDLEKITKTASRARIKKDKKDKEELISKEKVEKQKLKGQKKSKPKNKSN